MKLNIQTVNTSGKAKRAFVKAFTDYRAALLCNLESLTVGVDTHTGDNLRVLISQGVWHPQDADGNVDYHTFVVDRDSGLRAVPSAGYSPSFLFDNLPMNEGAGAKQGHVMDCRDNEVNEPGLNTTNRGEAAAITKDYTNKVIQPLRIKARAVNPAYVAETIKVHASASGLVTVYKTKARQTKKDTE